MGWAKIKFRKWANYSCRNHGEAFMIHGDKELAIKNYRRSLELNPENSGGAEMLKKLDKDK